MSNKKTSRVFDTWDALYDLLDGQTWPAHPTTGFPPSAPDDHSVYYGDMADDKTEAVIVAGILTAVPAAEFKTMGATNSLTEEFTLRVVVGTKVPGLTVREVRTRLADLCTVVQEALRSPLTGRPAGGFAQTVEGVQWWRVSRFAPQIYPLTDGYGGYAELDVLFNTYI